MILGNLTIQCTYMQFMLLKSEAGLLNIQSGIFGKQFSINFNFGTYIFLLPFSQVALCWSGTILELLTFHV